MDDVSTKNPKMSWHDGEVEIQRRAGVANIMAPVACQAIRRELLPQHQKFFGNLPFVIAAAVAPDGEVWATVLSGRPGFLQCPDPTTLEIATTADQLDPAWTGLGDGQPIGLLGIDLHSRRRNRLNGTFRRTAAGAFRVRVEESYGNCPQYIRARDFRFIDDPSAPTESLCEKSIRIEGHAAEMISHADTFFIASYVEDKDRRRHADVSHKAGRCGFAKLEDDGRLTFPDFAGNLYFNTLGNIFANPRCGLLFVDFDNGDVLQITGGAEIIFDSPEIAGYQGAERLIRVTPQSVVLRRKALPIRWTTSQQMSPNVLLTGSWQQAAARAEAARLAAHWRTFKVVETIDESSVVRSLFLHPADGVAAAPYQAGQHLPVRVQLSPGTAPVHRDYTISSAPSDGIYRISVKREGAVSQYLHSLRKGDKLEARAPAGSFTIDPKSPRPAIFLAAGIGITPLLSMLRHVVYEGQRTRFFRPVWVLYAARSKGERAFEREIVSLASAAEDVIAVTRVLSDVSDAVIGDFEIAGRISVEMLREVEPLESYDFYLCGPNTFMQEIYDGLLELNVSDKQIHVESFGSAPLQRHLSDAQSVLAPRSEEAVEVEFAASRKEGVWTDDVASLLELAEAQGLDPPSSCRAGSCGTCRTRILSGAVTYDTRPSTDVGEGEALICCAVPAEGTTKLRLDL
jgi:uncharacterized protein